eukprot:TRINITY_DN5471_c0_g1_i1.p1 TRINITY_DN5471_c0_g1~~TRINITY_DN5471_c0_g1_i1.p1  ORF type:complete len:310 (+),score=68.51 TRINITY_DN5471_c0_g1_i1:45-974(+)
MEGTANQQEFDRLSGLSVKELRQILQGRGVDFSDCFEKSDLVKKVADTAHISNNASKRTNVTTSQGVKKWKETLSDLECVVVQRDNVADSELHLVVIMCHGYGANNQDLAPIAEMILRSNPRMKVRFVYPNGIISVPGAGRAWWPLDMQDLMMKVMTGQMDAVFGVPPPGLSEARARILKLVEHIKKETGLPTSKIMLGGFSQGSMLAADVAFHLDEDPAALVVFSGVYLCKTLWQSQFANRKNLRVLQSHGTQDPILPYQLGTTLRQFFETNITDHNNYEFVSFVGGHTVGEQALAKFVQLIAKLTAQ